MQNSPIREVKRNARQLRREYSKQMAEEDTTKDIDNSGVTECQKYLLSLFKERPILNSKWLRKEGRYTRTQIRYAAEGLGLVIETVGFGDEKATTYTLPEDPLT
jgi:hypothetical protein